MQNAIAVALSKGCVVVAPVRVDAQTKMMRDNTLEKALRQSSI